MAVARTQSCPARRSRPTHRRHLQIIVVDSGSTDDSVAIAREHGATVIDIAPGTFTHGGSRNLGALRAQGEVLVFISQDAYPVC